MWFLPSQFSPELCVCAVYIHMCRCLEARGECWISPFSISHLCIVETEFLSHWTQSCHFSVRWADQQTPRIVQPVSTEVTGVPDHIQLFTWVLEIKLRINEALMLDGKHSYLLSHLQPSPEHVN